jgi:hypothetical protein
MRLRQAALALATCLGLGAAARTWNPAYTDVAAPSGLTGKNVYGGLERKDYILETTGNGVAIFDYDGDGAEDLFLANGTTLAGRGPAGRLQLYRNDGKGRFTDVAAKAGLVKTGWAQGACAADYDNDGAIDLLVTFYGHNTLYRNLGNGAFEDATAKAGLPTSGNRYGSGCSFVDYDRDGLLDLFVANYVDLDLASTPRPGQSGFCEWKGLAVMCGPRGLPLARNVLYRNTGRGRFADVSERAGILKPGGRYSLGVAAADFNDDGWPDIYVACDMTPSLLFQNRGDGTFEERGAEAGVAYNFDGRLQAGMGVAVGDYDNDGRLDIAKTNFSGDLTSLFHNDDGKFFTDVSREAGLGGRQLLGWGIAFLDADDDGWRDMVIANGHVYPEVEGARLGDTYRQATVLWRNRGDGKFVDATAESGAAFQVPRPARGLAVGDLDGDGRQEIVILNMNAAPSLLKSAAPPSGAALNIRLAGGKSNRNAIGARVTVEAGALRLVDEVMSGGSYYPHNSFILHFGLGSASRADRVQVKWPDGSVQEWRNLEANQSITLTQAQAPVAAVPFRR